MKRSAEDIIEIGRDLVKAKEKVGHGKFLDWINNEFEMGKETAYRFIKTYEKFGNQNSQIENFKASVLYELAYSPDSVINQAIEKSKNGEDVTVKEIKELKLKAKEAEKKTDNLQLEFQAKLENLEAEICVKYIYLV